MQSTHTTFAIDRSIAIDVLGIPGLDLTRVGPDHTGVGPDHTGVGPHHT